MVNGRALGTLLLVAVGLVLFALSLQYVDYGAWQSFAGVGGVFLFAFFGIVIGGLTEDIAWAVIGSSAITAFVMAYVYQDFAILMGLVFAVSLVIKIWDEYSASAGGGI